MILPIYKYGQTVLRKVGTEIDKDYPELQTLVDNMFETMNFSEGIGLAAPQIGRAIRLFIIDLAPFKDEQPEIADFKKVFINAKIIDSSEETSEYNEGCLSIPGINENVERPETITIKYQDLEFNEYTETYSGFQARVIQHEYDHIEGILFTDKIKPLRRQLLKRKLTNIAKGKIQCKYKLK